MKLLSVGKKLLSVGKKLLSVGENCMFARILVLLLSASVFLSCSEEEAYPSVVTEFVDALTDGNGMVAVIRTDDGGIYPITSQIKTGSPDSLYRCLCIYELGTDGEAYVYSMKHVFSAEPENSSVLVSHPQDPVKITSVWRKGDYINMNIGVLTTNAGRHGFAFCEDSVRVDISGCTSVYLSLLHLRPENDAESYTEKVYMSMPVRRYAYADTIVFSINSYDGLKVFKY